VLRRIYKRVAGLDVHKKTVTATRMRITTDERLQWETETFGTTTPELLQLHDWLLAWECTHVAMESTGEYWKPVYNVLEDSFELLVVNATHVHRVPGRKTDVTDSEWLAELQLHGLLKASFVPPKPQRALRELTRYRTRLVQERVRVVNRVQKLLEGANIKLSSVASDIMGVSGRAMLAEIVAGSTDAAALADLARGRMRNKIPALEQALTGRVGDHHRLLLTMQLAHIDFLDEQITAVETAIERQIETMPPLAGAAGGPTDAGGTPLGEPDDEPLGESDDESLTWTKAMVLLCSIPGVDFHTASVILAEIGIDMSQFPTAQHLAAWAGVAPGNHESAGKRYSGRTRKGNRVLTSALVQAAWGAARTKGTFLKARYHRLAARRGKKRAIVAVAHSMLVSIWHMLSRQEPYRELGSDYLDARKKEATVNYLTRRLEKLTGGAVRVELRPAA
jgi:transposase